MKGINVRSEIQQLRKVMLHRPGRELLYLTPDRLPELLFDDIPYLYEAQKEHDEFARILRENHVEVVYLEDLMTEVLDAHPELIDPFLDQWLEEADITTAKWKARLRSYLLDHYRGKDLVLKTMEGITLKEIGDLHPFTLQDLIAPPDDLVVDPMPNLYFARDPFASIGSGVSINRMRFPTRCRETIYAEYIFRYHPDFKDVKHCYDRTLHASIEGGDIINLTSTCVAIGISQRTSPDAIEAIARRMFNDPDCDVNTVLAFRIPESRAFMHLDTVFTAVDYDKYTVHPQILGTLEVFEITPTDNPQEVQIREILGTLEQVLEKYTGVDHVQLIQCGDGDLISAAREQWNDGSNTLCIAPGKIVVYSRNVVTNRALRSAGLEVIEMPSAELSRGRGGPRCMSMPLWRDA